MNYVQSLAATGILAIAVIAQLTPHSAQARLDGKAAAQPAQGATNPQPFIHERLAAAKRKSSGQEIRSVPTTPEAPTPKKKKTSKQKKKIAKPLPG